MLLVCLEIKNLRLKPQTVLSFGNALLQQTFTHVVIITFNVYCEIKVVQIQLLVAA